MPVFVGNVMVMLAYGLLLNAFRSFCNKPLGYHWAFGAIFWAVLCLIPDFYHSMLLRIIVSCLLCVFYTSALIMLLAQAPAELKATYWPASYCCGYTCCSILRVSFSTAVSRRVSMVRLAAQPSQCM
ncbi:hypothetical protein [Erwinia sp. V71]|uniref:hypothetical protein n=1 Tax=Erwinia sp. V71 TaxID=3369424 RepID=UPI003F6455E7